MEKATHESPVSWEFVIMCGLAFVAGIVAPEFLETRFAFDRNLTEAITTFLFLFFLPLAITPHGKRTGRLLLWAFIIALIASILSFAAKKLLHQVP